MLNAEALEVIDKVRHLVSRNFGGDYQAAFAYYDNRRRGRLGPRDLDKLLEDAGIGNWLTRGTWAQSIIAALDKDHDGTVALVELEMAISGITKA